MITLAAASQKGGVAKATTNLAIGAKLVEDGARVLYIDLDPQMNLSTTLKAQTGGVLSSLDVLTGEAGVAAAAQTIDGYDAVPASRLNGKADDLMPSVGKDYRLRKALEAVSDRYDFAILDTPPGARHAHGERAHGGLLGSHTRSGRCLFPGRRHRFGGHHPGHPRVHQSRSQDSRHPADALQPAHAHIEDHP